MKEPEDHAVRDPLSGGAAIDGALRSAFREVRARKGSCPESSALADYLSGESPAADAERIRQHIECCGECDSIAERMKALDRPALTAPGWGAAGRRIAVRLGLSEPRPGILGRLFGQPHAAAWNPLFAYALAATLLYPAYLGMVPRQTGPASEAAPATPPVRLEAARNFELDQSRGSGREILLGDGEETFIVTFFLPVRAGHDYFASAGGVRTKLASPDPGGNLYLVCNRRVFPPGEHTLHVTEVNRETGARRELPVLDLTVR